MSGWLGKRLKPRRFRTQRLVFQGRWVCPEKMFRPGVPETDRRPTDGGTSYMRANVGPYERKSQSELYVRRDGIATNVPSPRAALERNGSREKLANRRQCVCDASAVSRSHCLLEYNRMFGSSTMFYCRAGDAEPPRTSGSFSREPGATRAQRDGVSSRTTAVRHG